ncbi:helix-turn-helix transcriptional regulator [Sphingomonas sp. BGYR3]|uniref:helix-turn-helix domain-containing protein n=1 Tax=Sphingomonas sp. BGYR3 TaxID=2975483 RepID=UPI0021A62F2A|nr:helix-turn-helix transcriptional regulator [Sphingomonas sp. BGYR3]MDG5489059.1 helix-turn-helix transcriptional regulator [Sphingomonas sp. BGYR3]
MDEDAILLELGNRIRTQRKAIGLTQEALALAAGVDRSYYGAVERGERNVTFTVLCRLCIALRCDVAKLTSKLPERQ